MPNSLDPMFALLAQLPAAVRANMVTMYSDSLAGQVAQLAQLMIGGDAPAMQAAAHKIAGAAAMMQDRDLSHAARSMEALLRGGDTPAAVQEWPRIQACALVTLDGLRTAA